MSIFAHKQAEETIPFRGQTDCLVCPRSSPMQSLQVSHPVPLFTYLDKMRCDST